MHTPVAISMNLMKRLAWLGAVSIVAVVINHAVQWGFTLMHWSGGPALDTDLPPLMYYTLISLERLATFCVPAFLCISGFFLAFAARGPGAEIGRRVLQPRLVDLAVPYLIWSLVLFAIDAAWGVVFTPQQYLWKLLHGGALGPYFFVLVLAQLYLLSPWLLRALTARPRATLGAALALQVVVGLIVYSGVLGTSRALWYLALPWVGFFILGMAASLRLDALKAMLARQRRIVFAVALVLAVLAIVEADLGYRLTGGTAWRDTPFTWIGSLYSLAVSAAVLAGEGRLPFARAAQYLSTRTYGVYLTHALVLTVLASLLARAASGLLAQGWWMWLPLAVVALGLPLLVMHLVARLRRPRLYRTLFG
jgi:peptidoglycan/LPS O-acetylase OafA/YrhL